MFILPFILIVIIFILVSKKHSENPDLLSCTSFERTLITSVPLYVEKSEFDKSITDICLCFKRNNSNSNPKQFVTKKSLDICAKDKISTWIFIDKDNVSTMTIDSRVKCFKEGVYEKIIVPKILKELEITHESGFFRNDLFQYKEDKSFLITSIYNSCSK
ncbi:hypothetical protein [Neisseria animaloris]|uniref:hypothetical protein n=1 Tax=Neisseria animaloris TaxID=326522 RepID=UPI00131A8054|nr:hypothetical protein [Neisseria animaloris]